MLQIEGRCDALLSQHATGQVFAAWSWAVALVATSSDRLLWRSLTTTDNLQVSIVRELHVYGAVVAVHARDASKHQHQVSRCSIHIAALRLDEPASGGCNIGGTGICSIHSASLDNIS
jgi:hypothetical protein